MLRVDLTALDDGLHELNLAPSADDLDLDPAVFSDIAVALRLNIAEGTVQADFATRATATLECDRTLAEYRQPVQGTHEVLFTDAAIGEDEDPPEVDLTEPVRDTLLLALPLRRVSPEAEETDIPTRFGGPAEGEPADDRWDALRRLRDADPEGDSD